MLVLESEEHARARGARDLRRGRRRPASPPTPTTSPHPTPTGAGAVRAMRAGRRAPATSRSRTSSTSTRTPRRPRSATSPRRKAIRAALGGDADHVAVSATKSMTGHLLGAAGALEGVVQRSWPLHHRVAPPTINLDDLDPEVTVDVVRKEPAHAARRRHRRAEQLVRLRRPQRRPRVPERLTARRPRPHVALPARCAPPHVVSPPHVVLRRTVRADTPHPGTRCVTSSHVINADCMISGDCMISAGMGRYT